MNVLDHVGRGSTERIGDHRHLRVLQRHLDLGRGGRLGPAEQLQAVLVGVLNRDAVIGEDLLGEVEVLLGHHLAQGVGKLFRRLVGVHALVFVRDHDVDAVGMVADVLIDPVELDLELLRSEADGAKHPEAARFAYRDDDIAAVCEREDRKLDAELVADGSVHACSWNARRIETCSSLVRIAAAVTTRPPQSV